jgi:hypothetical protein
MSEHLKTIPTEDLHAEILRRKAGEVSAMREAIAGHRSAITALEVKVTALTGATTPKAGRTRHAKIPHKDAETAVLQALDTSATPLGTSAITGKVGFDGIQLKQALTRLEASKAIKRTGKARGTVYGVA